MKLVIKISGRDVGHQGTALKIARVASELLEEGHHPVIVHGGFGAALDAVARCGVDLERGRVEAWRKEMACMLVAGKVNGPMMAAMSAIGVPAFGFCGADGNAVRVRRGFERDRQPCSTMDVAAFDPFWIDLIAKHGSVPVVASCGLGPDGQYHYLDANQLAAECAIAWDADALILLTQDDGIRDEDGSVVRWLVAEQMSPVLKSTLSPDVHSKLTACLRALKRGVRRVRILPISEIESLSLFYSSRINYGTEVILSAD